MAFNMFYKKPGEDGWFVKEDTEWTIPVSAIEYFGVFYKVMAHGSIVSANGTDAVVALGTEIITRPTEIEELEDDYFKFIYKKDSKFMETTNTAKSVHSLYKMLDLILTGRVSNRVPYTMYLDTLKNSMMLNAKIAVSPQILSCVLGTVFRDTSDPKTPARCSPGKPYTAVGLSELPAINNTFSAVFGENFSRSMLIATGNTRKQQEVKMSPLEPAIRM